MKLSPEINNTPSRVLHFRGIPADTTEGEIVQLGMTFGRMTNLVLAKKKNQVSLVIQTYEDKTQQANLSSYGLAEVCALRVLLELFISIVFGYICS